MRVIHADIALEARATTGEGPVWDDRSRELVWLDIPRGEVHRFDPSTGSDAVVLALDQPIGAAGLRQGDGLVLAMRDGFAVWDADGLRLLADTEADVPGNRMNDGKPDPSGRFWAGTMALDMAPGAGTLYRLDPDGSVRAMLGGLGVSNGLDWTVDRKRMYFVDSLAGGVDLFDYDDAGGWISGRRRFADVPAATGLPDGLTVDSEDHVWVAIWDGGAVHRYAPDGALDLIVSVPARQVTSCGFGGPGLDELYITTAAAGLGDADARDQHAGALFVCRPGAAGRPAFRFCG